MPPIGVDDPASPWVASLLAGAERLDDLPTATRRSNGAVFLAASDAGWCCCRKARASEASALQPVALKRPETGGSDRECTTRRLRGVDGVDGVSGAPPASGLPEPAASA